MKPFTIFGLYFSIQITKAKKDPEKVIKKIMGLKDIRGDKTEPKTKARQIVIFYLRSVRKLPNKEAAGFFGKTPSATNNSMKIITNLIDTEDKKYYPIINKFINKME